MSAFLRRFRLEEHGTTVGREVQAGVVTFATLSYVLFVHPVILAGAGMDPGGVLFATCVASALACCAMAFLANYPIALAPAMGHNVFFAVTVCGLMGFTWQQALAANLLSGACFLALAGTRVRERVLEAVPPTLVLAIAGGIGLLIALLGFQWGGLVVADPATLVRLGDLGSPPTLLFLAGLALHAVLFVRRVPGALLLGLLATALAGLAASSWFGLEAPLVVWRGIVGAPPSPAGTAFALDFAGLFAHPLADWLAVLLVLLFLDLFDTVGSLLALARQAGLVRAGRLPRARAAFSADALGTVVGACLGTSTVTSYVESAAGIAAGGRTGLAALVTGVLMLAALFLAPLCATVGAGVTVPGAGGAAAVLHPVVAPVLVLVGVLMMRAVGEIEWHRPERAIPAFLTLVVMPLSFSITDGIAFGFLSWSLLSLVRGRAREEPALVHVLSILFLLRYVFLA